MEGLTAFVALASAAVLPLAVYTEYIDQGWIFILQNGYAQIAGNVFTFIPLDVWAIWGGLLGSIFMITTLGSGGRNMRIFMLELYTMATKRLSARKCRVLPSGEQQVFPWWLVPPWPYPEPGSISGFFSPACPVCWH